VRARSRVGSIAVCVAAVAVCAGTAGGARAPGAAAAGAGDAGASSDRAAAPTPTPPRPSPHPLRLRLTSISRQPTGRIRGWLHTEGTRIVDARGRAVRFRGVDVSGMGHGWGSPVPGAGRNGCPSWTPPPPTEFSDVARWGFNVVRVSFSWANLEPAPPAGPLATGAHHYNRAYVQALARTIHGFTRRGVAVILQMSQNSWSPAFRVEGPHHTKCGVGMPSWLYGVPSADAPDRSSTAISVDEARRSFFADRGGVQRAFAAAWAFVAGRFAHDQLVVGADMMNEPYTSGAFPTSALHLAALYRRVGDAVRRADPHLLLIFQDSQYAGPGSFALRRPPQLPDVVYTFHMYQPSWSPNGLRVVRTYERRARAWNVPLWISEFDAFGYASPSGASGDWARRLRGMLAYCRRNDIGWTEFAYARRWMLDPATGRVRAGLIPVLRAG